MTPWLDDGDVRLYAGDCLSVMRELPADSIDAVITDPPYGLEFMGKAWDALGAGSNDERWRDRRTSAGAPRVDPAAPGSRHGARTSPARPNPLCSNCGHYAYSSTPCRCESPTWAARENTQEQRMQEWHRRWAVEAFRVLKPGGHLASFGGTRTSHRLASGIEDAGFEIRDTLAWLYGSGFTKSLDVSKAIDKAAGAEREIVETIPDRWAGKGSVLQRSTQDERTEAHITTASTDDAKAWQGWGTALKPAHEPITLARKPLAGTVAANVLAHGTGALNIDACRTGTNPGYSYDAARNGTTFHGEQGERDVQTAEKRGADRVESTQGRWPANVILDAEAAAILDQQTGEQTDGVAVRRNGMSSASIWGNATNTDPAPDVGYGDRGGASRFFYTAKASSNERNDGLHDLPRDEAAAFDHRPSGDFAERMNRVRPPVRNANTHPTVKPVDLMRWLIRLLAPPGALILDPFAGSGTTGVAARHESVRCILIEREAEYLPIIAGRLSQQSLLA